MLAFVAFVPRLGFDPTFATRFATRYDLDIGVNKVFNFDGDLHRVGFSGDSAAATVWSLGFTAGAQRRWRDPSPSSYAVFVVPSISYVIADQWNAAFVLDIIQRWYDTGAGHELTVGADRGSLSTWFRSGGWAAPPRPDGLGGRR